MQITANCLQITANKVQNEMKRKFLKIKNPNFTNEFYNSSVIANTKNKNK